MLESSVKRLWKYKYFFFAQRHVLEVGHRNCGDLGECRVSRVWRCPVCKWS